MANMLYNGVELPDIESVWTDKTAYPYAIIRYAYTNTFSASRDSLFLCSSRSTATELGVHRWARFNYIQYYYDSENSRWVYDDSGTNMTTGFELNNNVIWTSYDLYDYDGSLFLAASDPVDPNAPAEPTYDKTAFLSGLAMGLCGKGDPTSGMTVSGDGGASGNYLYNGVELPDINTVWTDKATYPYAVVIDMNAMTSGAFSYGCYLFSSPLIEVDSAEEGQFFGSSTAIDVVIYAVDGSNWVYQTSGNDIFSVNGDWLVWSNHDILTTDNTIYLAASDPVPAGGTDAFTKGYLTGAELRRKRVIPASTPSANGDGFALYNGVKLPNIDSVWTDKTTYPYATLTRYNTAYILYLTDTQSSVRSDGYPWFSAGTNVAQCVCTFDESIAAEEGINTGEWIFLGEAVFPQDGNLTDPVVWVSYDILNPDNTVYLAASDPIPLDGYTVIEWDGNTEGLEKFQNYYRIADYSFATDALFVGADSEGSSSPVISNYYYEESVSSWLVQANVNASPGVYGISELGASELGVSSGIYALYTSSELPDGKSYITYIKLIAYKAT